MANSRNWMFGWWRICFNFPGASMPHAKRQRTHNYYNKFIILYILTCSHHQSAHMPFTAVNILCTPWRSPSHDQAMMLRLIRNTVGAFSLLFLFVEKFIIQVFAIGAAIKAAPVAAPNNKRLTLYHACESVCGWIVSFAYVPRTVNKVELRHRRRCV